MNPYRVNQKLDIETENGIWLDYADHTWFFMVKDDIWQPEEIHNTECKQITVSFLERGIVDLFLLNINDCMETSDVPLCLFDATKDLYNSFKDSECYSMQLILLDKDNVVRAVRSGEFSRASSMGIKKILQKRRLDSYDERSYSAAYTKLCKKYQPFELEQFVLYTQQF